MRKHRDWMTIALEQAVQAGKRGDVPIGAVVVWGSDSFAVAGNERELRQDPTAHAEIIAMRQAAERIGHWRLHEARLYVTLEPCPMCAGAIVQARLKHLIYGAADLKGGGVDSVLKILRPGLWNHTVEITSGVMEEECRLLLKDFFLQKR